MIRWENIKTGDENMAYADEELIQMMNGYKSGQHGTLESGIYIKEELYEFIETFLFEDKVSVMLPKTFDDMPMELAKLKYPMEQRPQVIKSNEVTDINFTFSLVEQPLTNDKVESITGYIYQVFQTLQPVNDYFEKKVEHVGALSMGWFDFKSHGIDDTIYNLMFYIPIGGKTLQGIFNCRMSVSELWKPVALQVMQSVKDLSMQKGEGCDA